MLELSHRQRSHASPTLRAVLCRLEGKKPQMNTMALVEEFHRAFGQPVREKPGFPEPSSDGLKFTEQQDIRCALGFLSDALRVFRSGAPTSRLCLRLALETEELKELAEAFLARDLAAALDAQVDREYILQGTNVELGFCRQASSHERSGLAWSTFQEAIKRVHAANMAKLGPDGKPIVDCTGKVRKPEGWAAADLSDLV